MRRMMNCQRPQQGRGADRRRRLRHCRDPGEDGRRTTRLLEPFRTTRRRKKLAVFFTERAFLLVEATLTSYYELLVLQVHLPLIIVEDLRALLAHTRIRGKDFEKIACALSSFPSPDITTTHQSLRRRLALPGPARISCARVVSCCCCSTCTGCGSSSRRERASPCTA